MIEVISSLAIPEGLFIDLGLIIILAAFFAYFVKLIKQPLIPAYIIAGLVLGPIGLGIITDLEIINSISEIGIMFLLFIVGMEMNLNKLKTVGWAAIITGTLQVVLTFLAGFFIASWLGFDSMNSIYAGLIVAFSSTMVVIKLLFDKNELKTLHGRIILGILFLQDVFVILALTIFMGTTDFGLFSILPIIGKFLIIILIAYLINRFLAFPIFRTAAESGELLLIMAVGFSFLFALMAYFFGFSIAIGAFLAGITLANLPYSKNITARTIPLKDFFATIFFVSLGLQLVSVNFSSILIPLLIFLGIVIIIKPLIILTILSIMGYDKRNAFASAISLAQISEFSLILVMSISTVSQDLFTITILAAVITITLTSYIIKYEMTLYSWGIPILKYFEKLSSKHKQLGYEHTKKSKVILFGANRTGTMFLRSLKRVKKFIFVIDFNPEVIEKLRQKKIRSLYGDMTNPEVLKRISFNNAKFIISTAQNVEDNIFLVDYLKSINCKALTFITAETIADALELYDIGADYVMVPNVMAGERVAQFLEKNLDDPKSLRKIKRKHLKHLLEMDSEKLI
jgi:Kef-type K+ transport system membrane component KefB